MRIPTLPLPSTLPAERALASCNETSINYDPEFWEFEYEGYRYLERLTIDYLNKRYEDIIRNFVRLVSTRKNVISILSYHSSWYWYKKEYQTRLEFYLRGLRPRVDLPKHVPNNDEGDAPERSKYPNGGDVLFRFGKHDELLPIRIGLASRHLCGKSNDPRTDNELEKNSFMAGEYTKITTISGVSIPIIGDFKYTTSGKNYYDLCMSCVYHKELFSDFNADACFVIKSPEIFADRISCAAKRYLPNHDLFHNPVQYYDPYTLGKNEFFDLYMSKDFSYAYQMEYRFIWFSKDNIKSDKFIFLDIGSIEDVGYIYKP